MVAIGSKVLREQTQNGDLVPATLSKPCADPNWSGVEAAEFAVSYTVSNGRVTRHIRTHKGVFTSSVDDLDHLKVGVRDLHASFDRSWLRAKSWPTTGQVRGRVRVADLFCGSGGLTLGAWEACRALGFELHPVFAVDNDGDAIEVYRRNFEPTVSFASTIENLVGDTIGSPISAEERTLLKSVGDVDLLLAGPPCQGHSDLNNFTRRSDPRNSLIHRVVRFAELARPKHVIIENVQGVRHDKSGAFQSACRNLRQLGYNVTDFLLEAQTIGVPQRRRRCFIVATTATCPTVEHLVQRHYTPERTFDWACRDLEGLISCETFDTAAKVFAENQRRMEFLLAHDLYDLPNEERPDCHRLKKHEYTSVYGRLHPDTPTPTITTGFGSPGQGRYTHPRAARTLTPHEAARLQFLPDFFRFDLTKRKRLQKLIGNAVPSKLGFVLVLDLLANA